VRRSYRQFSGSRFVVWRKAAATVHFVEALAMLCCEEASIEDFLVAAVMVQCKDAATANFLGAVSAVWRKNAANANVLGAVLWSGAGTQLPHSLRALSAMQR